MGKRFHIEIILKVLGICIFVLGLLMFICIPVALIYKEDTVLSILFSSLSCFLIAVPLLVYTRKSGTKNISNKDVYAIVTLVWFVIGFFAAFPFIYSGAISNFTNAYFEAVSGLTTTGATILVEIEEVPKSILIWRSFIQWIGGLGILVLVISVMSFLGSGDVKMFVTEASGSKTTKLHPKIGATARRLWYIYLGMTIILVVLLILGGKNLYESVCHAFTTVATGGFSPNNDSIASYSSYNQIVITVFMFFGAVNFSLYFALFTGKFKQVFRNEELIAFFSFVCIMAVIIAGDIYYYGIYSTIGESVKHSFFQVVSIVTTTGFGTADYDQWPAITQVIMLFLCFTGGMIGSTAGGVKFSRLFVLVKNIRFEVRKIIHPNGVFSLKVNKINIESDIVRNFFSVFIAWILFTCLGTLILSFFVSNLSEAIGVAAATLGAVGPAFGEFGPAGSYAGMLDGGKWTCIFLMILGRLEIITVLSFIYALLVRRGK
jgi:trk system potassium uptake protein